MIKHSLILIVGVCCLVGSGQAQNLSNPEEGSQKFPPKQETVGEYILVATQEGATPPIPCRMYQTNMEESGLSLMIEIPPQQGIRHVTGYPRQRKVAIWRGEEQDRGSLILVDVDMPEDRRSVALPFDPVLGSYLIQEPEENPFFAAWHMPGNRAYLYCYAVFLDRLDRVNNMRWENTLLRGTNALRRGGQLMDVMINIERGTFWGMFNRLVVDLPFQLDGEAWQFYQQLKPTETKIWGNNEHVCVVGAQEAGESPEQFFVFLYDKEQQNWTHVAVQGTHSHIQVFNEWVVIQQAFPNMENPNEPLILTGQYTFYHLDSGEQFVWQADSQTEVLGMWENTILYRIEDELFEATIVGTEVTEAQLLCQDPVIQDVHWAFIVLYSRSEK